MGLRDCKTHHCSSGAAATVFAAACARRPPTSFSELLREDLPDRFRWERALDVETGEPVLTGVVGWPAAAGA
jgi:hypothetical protein